MQYRCNRESRLLSSALMGQMYRTLSPDQFSFSIRDRMGKNAASVLPPAVGAKTINAGRRESVGSPRPETDAVRASQTVDDVVLQRGMESIEVSHSSSSIASTSVAPIACRSTGVSSASLIVNA